MLGSEWQPWSASGSDDGVWADSTRFSSRRNGLLSSPFLPIPRTPRLAMDNSPTALFDSYEQDFQQIISSIREKLEGDGKDERGGALCCRARSTRCLTDS